jgi:hypothetical protein
MSTADPHRTHALVVGIDHYRAGESWSLAGPADDARRYTAWLLARGVPAAQVLVFLSPTEPHRDWARSVGVHVQVATREHLHGAITDTLHTREGDLLVLCWGGHGVLTTQGSRRLFYADATAENKLNLDVNGLLAFLRTDYFLGLPRQLAIIDACQNYVDEALLLTALPHEKFPDGHPLGQREQFVLFAARPGELAGNDPVRRSGVLSHAVLELLEASRTPWPPDMEGLLKRLRDKFTDLRAEGRVRQTPTALVYQTWSGDQRSIWHDRPTSTRSAPTTVNALRSVPAEQVMELAWKLHATVLGDREARETLLQHLRPEIGGFSRRSNRDVFDIVEILMASSNYAGGLEELFQVVRAFGGEDSSAVQDLVRTVRRILPDVQLDQS